MKTEYTKNKQIKLVDDDNKALHEVLVSDGWECESSAPSDRDILKEKAHDLGIEYPNNIKTTKLEALIKDKENDNS